LTTSCITPGPPPPPSACDRHADFDNLRPILSKHLAYGDNLLVLGPGLSALHERLYDAGYRGLTVADAAQEVLAHAKARAEAGGRAGIKFECADVVEGLEYPRYSYNAVIDKVGSVMRWKG